MAMTPRDRVLASLEGNPVFPVPTDVFENGLHPKLEEKLLQHYGLAEGAHEELLRALGACLRWAKPLYVGPRPEEDLSREPTYPHQKVTRNIWGTWDGWATYYDGIDRPLRSAETVAEVEAHYWPSADWFDYSRVGWVWNTPDSHLPIAQWAAVTTDYARLGGGWNPIFCRIMDLYGMETGLMHLAARPDLIHATVEQIGQFLEKFYLRLASAGKGYYDFLAFGDDFASQRGMLLSLSHWRRYFLPVWKRLFAIAHEHGMKTVLHSCGSVRAVLGDLIDAGLDVLQVVQVTAVGMEPAELKREFGRHLAFYGGMDTQHIMPSGRTSDVRIQTRRLIDILGKGGRYIFSTMHFLMDDVPLENALAMYEEAKSYRAKPVF